MTRAIGRALCVTILAVGLAGAKPQRLAAPPAVIVIPEPARTLPALDRFLSWVSLLEPQVAPSRLRKEARVLGIDPFDGASLAKVLGADPKGRLSIWLAPASDAAVIELPLAQPKSAAAALAKVAASGLRVEPIGGGPGFVLGPSAATGVAAHHADRRLFLQVGARTRGLDRASPFGPLDEAARRQGAPVPPPPSVELAEDARLRPILRALGARPARKPPSVVKGHPAADLWLFGRGLEGTERVEGAIWLGEKGWTARVEALPSFAYEVVLPEIIPGKARSRRLIALDAAAEVTARAGVTGIRELVDRWIGPGLDGAKLFTGDLHAVLGTSGDLAAALELEPRAPAEMVEKLTAAVKARYPRATIAVVEVSEGGPRVLAVALGGMKEGALTAAVRAQPRGGADRAVVELTARPGLLMDALAERSRAGDGVGVPPAQLVLVRLLAAPILDATDRLTLTVDRGGPYIRASADVAYR